MAHQPDSHWHSFNLWHLTHIHNAPIEHNSIWPPCNIELLEQRVLPSNFLWVRVCRVRFTILWKPRRFLGPPCWRFAFWNFCSTFDRWQSSPLGFDNINQEKHAKNEAARAHVKRKGETKRKAYQIHTGNQTWKPRPSVRPSVVRWTDECACFSVGCGPSMV